MEVWKLVLSGSPRIQSAFTQGEVPVTKPLGRFQWPINLLVISPRKTRRPEQPHPMRITCKCLSLQETLNSRSTLFYGESDILCFFLNCYRTLGEIKNYFFKNCIWDESKVDFSNQIYFKLDAKISLLKLCFPNVTVTCWPHGLGVLTVFAWFPWWCTGLGLGSYLANRQQGVSQEWVMCFSVDLWVFWLKALARVESSRSGLGQCALPMLPKLLISTDGKIQLHVGEQVCIHSVKVLYWSWQLYGFSWGGWWR